MGDPDGFVEKTQFVSVQSEVKHPESISVGAASKSDLIGVSHLIVA
jgi:hypothetical protein